MGIRNEQGFTFISMIMTLTVIMVTLPILVHILKLMAYTSNYDELSIQQFTYFLRDEVNQSIDFDVNNNVLYLDSADGRKVTFKKYDDQITRQVNNKGYDVFARNISDIVFTKLTYGVHVKITSLKGAIYEKQIVFPQ